MKNNEFVGAAVLATGIAIMVASTFALLEERDTGSLSDELQKQQHREWINDLIEMRRQEMLNKIKYKPL